MACWSSVSNGSFVARRRSIRFDLVAVLIFGVLLNTTSMFNHDNVRIADKLDLILRWVVVTPDMHRVHHSIQPTETNSNFGFNLSWWDRLFGTYRPEPSAGQEAMTIGIEKQCWRCGSAGRKS
jgi:sterol desaturase/sphingolipid hydroxylase (fatty acid hydroxylase superfamily)